MDLTAESVLHTKPISNPTKIATQSIRDGRSSIELVDGYMISLTARGASTLRIEYLSGAVVPPEGVS